MTPNFGSFDDEQFDERRIERLFSENPDLVVAECWYWILKLQARFFVGDYASAIEASSRAHRLLWRSSPLLERAEYHFYAALSRAASYDSALPDQGQLSLEAVASHHSELAVWAEHGVGEFREPHRSGRRRIARIEGPCSMPSTCTNKPSVPPVRTALSIVRRLPTSLPHVSTKGAGSKRSDAILPKRPQWLRSLGRGGKGPRGGTSSPIARRHHPRGRSSPE